MTRGHLTRCEFPLPATHVVHAPPWPCRHLDRRQGPSLVACEALEHQQPHSHSSSPACGRETQRKRDPMIISGAARRARSVLQESDIPGHVQHAAPIRGNSVTASCDASLNSFSL